MTLRPETSRCKG